MRRYENLRRYGIRRHRNTHLSLVPAPLSPGPCSSLSWSLLLSLQLSTPLSFSLLLSLLVPAPLSPSLYSSLSPLYSSLPWSLLLSLLLSTPLSPGPRQREVGPSGRHLVLLGANPISTRFPFPLSAFSPCPSIQRG